MFVNFSLKRQREILKPENARYISDGKKTNKGNDLDKLTKIGEQIILSQK
jgi:hypothetical protein